MRTTILLSTLATMAFALPANPSSNTAPVQQYYQCGGSNYSGSTTCATGLVCKAWNPYYSQCISPDDGGPIGSQTGSNSTTPATGTTPTTGQTGTAPTATATGSAEGSGTGEKTYTLDTFIQFLEQKAGGETANMVRRLVESLNQ